MPSADQFGVWIVVGIIAGTLVGRLLSWKKEGFGLWRNWGLGLSGALIGGLLFRLAGIFPELDSFSISLRDIVAAVLGSFLVLAAYWYVTRGAR